MRWSVLAAGAILSILSGRAIVVAGMLYLPYYEYKRFVLRSKLPVDQWPKRLYN